MPLEFFCGEPRLQTPYFDRVIRTSGRYGCAVRRERHGMNSAFMPSKKGDLPLPIHVPNPENLVTACGDQTAAIRRERQCQDVAAVPLQNSHDSAFAEVPENDHAIVTGRRERPPIPGEHRALDPTSVR